MSIFLRVVPRSGLSAQTVPRNLSICRGNALRPANSIASACFAPQTARHMATHRDLGSRLGGSGGANSGWHRTGFWGRWKVPLLFTGAVIAFDYFVLPRIMEMPALTPLRRHPEYAVYGIIGINCLGFLAWRGRGLQLAMMRYGLLQKEPSRFNVWSMLGSAFSHQEWWHLGLNMFVVYQFGIPVARWLGTSMFLESYIDSCAVSSLFSLMLPSLLRRYSVLPSLGASGAVFSTFGTFCWLAPNARLALWFIPLPFGAWWVFLGTAAWNAWGMFRKSGGIDYAGHLGGSVMGVVYGWIAQRRIQEARRRARQQNQFRWR